MTSDSRLALRALRAMPIVSVAAALSLAHGIGANTARFDLALPLGCEPLLRGRETNLDRRSSWWLFILMRL